MATLLEAHCGYLGSLLGRLGALLGGFVFQEYCEKRNMFSETLVFAILELPEAISAYFDPFWSR